MALQPKTLAELRDLVQKLHQGGGPIPFEELLQLANQAELNKKGVSIDLAASEELGFPLVALHQPGPAVEFDTLSARELEVATLIAQGLTNREIADRLFLTLGTVKDHVHNILEKTGMANRSSVAAKFRAV